MRFDTCTGALNNDSVCIFLLHGVIKESNFVYRNFNRKHILEEEFETFIHSLKNNGNSLTTGDLIDIANGRPVSPKSFVITFDDGFKNNLTVAAPILEKYQVPATFYVTTEFVSENAMSWIDRIDWAIEESSNRASIEIALPWASASRRLTSKNSRLSLLKEIRSFVNHNRNIDQSSLANNIQTQLGFETTRAADGELDAKLTWEDLSKLSQSELFTIGSHTHTNRIM